MWLAAALAGTGACHRAGRSGDTAAPVAGADGPTAESPPIASPELIEFRRTLLQADEAQWRMLDMGYLQVAAALGQVQVRPVDYGAHLDETRSPDPDTRANGYCGLAASRRSSALDHLVRCLRDEPDAYNRTIAVWCIRTFGDRRRVTDALDAFLADCRDLDLGRCIADDGTIQSFRSPFPLAGFEAFKGLVVLRGTPYMLEGEGWRRFIERVGRSVRPEPLTAIDFSRLRGGTDPKTDPYQRMRDWIDEMRDR